MEQTLLLLGMLVCVFQYFTYLQILVIGNNGDILIFHHPVVHTLHGSILYPLLGSL